MIRFFVLIVCVFFLGCGGSKDDTPQAPEASLLVFPLQNSECTTGESTNEFTSLVTFEWQASALTDTYTIVATNLNTGNSKTSTTATTSAALIIDKGEPYEWYVISENEKSNESVQSAVWRFYNAGSRTTFVPFPAAIISPKSGASVPIDLNNEVELDWEGSDIDNDITTYEIYLSTENPPNTLAGSSTANNSVIKVDAAANTIYYWRVVTIDSEGNASDSGVFEYRAL